MTDDDALDFRADPMESPDGRGFARRAWNAYAKRSNQMFGPALRPLLEPSAKKLGASMTVDLFGFWLLWQLEGGYDGMRRLGMSRSAIYRRIKLFRTITGMHPDEYVLPGVETDVQTYRKTKPYARKE